MQANIRKINKYRKFSEDFKRKLVEEFEFEKYVLNLPKQNRPTETIYTDGESECKTRPLNPNIARL